MRLTRAGLLLALAATAARAHAADDKAARVQTTSSDASSRAPTQGYLNDKGAGLTVSCGGSGALGYMYCRAVDWSTWLLLSGQRALRPPGGGPLDTDEARRRLQWGSTSGMRFATRSYEPMHK